ncbi:MAG: methylenetetrahydrofolate--tRNA-(uracil(54)-C(5))-methyltransferase (FADH(2)-oxidizing) TrmFO, partial [Sandaracinobacteroides sp.]
FDAIAPIVYANSVDMDIAWRQSRYDKGADGEILPPGEGDYINCPLSKAQYLEFVEALNAGEKADFKDWELDTPYFEGCMPIEVMADRGANTLRFGPMKPVGLRDPRTGKGAWAVVQLRQDNLSGTLLNIVGFQTKLKHAEQMRIFRTIPGLERAEFARLGGLHRNSFIRSPILLDETLRLKTDPRISFAGQITGCEGYVESAAVGLMAGRFLADRATGRDVRIPPPETAMGALLGHITGNALADSFQPMNVNFGLFPPLYGVAKGRERKAEIAARAKAALAGWLAAA